MNWTMVLTIYASAKFEFQSVIRFLKTEENSASEIHLRMNSVWMNDENLMIDSSVWEWCRKFKEVKTDVYDEEGQRHKSVASANLI